MKRFFIFGVLFLFVVIPVYAEGVDSWREMTIPKVTNELALGMLEKYQSVKQYHCKWLAEFAQGKQQGKIELEVAFDRKTGKTLFVIRSSYKKDDKWIFYGQVHVYDGQKVQRAMTQSPGAPMQQAEQIIADPNQFTYRDFRKRIAFFSPFDLPALYPDHALTLYPLMEMLQGGPKKVRTIEPDPNDPAKMPGLELMTNETCARMHLDAKTLLIKDFVYFDKTSGKTNGPLYKQTFISINKPLKPELFDFKAHLKRLESEGSK